MTTTFWLGSFVQVYVSKIKENNEINVHVQNAQIEYM